MHKRQLYWVCQFGGWALFIGYEATRFAPVLQEYIQRSGGELSPGREYGQLLLNGTLNILLGIGITHLYRYMALRYNWLNMPIRRLAPRALIGAAVVTAFMSGINLPLDYFMFPEVYQGQVDEAFALYSFLGWGKYMILWVSFYHLFHFAERSSTAELRRTQAERQLAEMELQRLRSQLNPHFLFNALNSLRSLVAENPRKAQEGITRLSNLLRQALKNDLQGVVPLEKELQTVRDYLVLEGLRLENRLTLRWNVEAGLEHVLTPSMLVLTLVENAIKHGIAPRPEGGLLSIEIRREGPNLVLDVLNTGRYEPTPEHEGFGLLNTTRRLQLTYGPAASLHITQLEPELVRTRLVLPLGDA
jgi:two-component sensor histidine kinase